LHTAPFKANRIAGVYINRYYKDQTSTTLPGREDDPMRRDYFDQWNEHLSNEEKKALDEILQWEGGKKDTKTLQGFSLSYMKEAERKFPEVTKAVSQVTREVMTKLRDYARLTIDEGAIAMRVSLKCGEALEGGQSQDQIPLSILDETARESLRFNVITACTEGALTGTVGPLGFALDVPMVYTILFRLIQEVAVSYGYSIDSPEEKLYILKILELGHYSDDQSRNEAITDLYTLHAAIRGGMSLNYIERSGIMKGFQSLCSHIGLTYSKRKLSALFIIAGGIMGGAMNYILAREIADAAFNTYRKRFIMDRAQARCLNRM
jgi:hypothetical protein